MNQVGALNSGANADLAASGINSLSGGSFGADFALLLGQISQDGSSGIGGALAQDAVRSGRTGFANVASKTTQRRKDSSKSPVQDLLGSRQGGASAKAPQEAASKKAQAKPADDAQTRRSGDAQESVDGRSQGAEAAKVQDHAEDAKAAPDDGARAQEAPDPQAAQGAAAAAPKAPSDATPDADAQAAEDPALDGLIDVAGDADPLIEDGASDGNQAARAQASSSTIDAAQGPLKSLQGGEGQEISISSDELKAAADAAASKDPVQASPVSENSAALGELFEDAGVTKVTVSQSQDAVQSQDAQEVADELSSIADSVKAADELFQGQDNQAAQGGEGGQGSGNSAQDGVDGALAVLRQGVKGGEDGAEAEGAADASGSTNALSGRALPGAAPGSGNEAEQDPRATLSQGTQAAPSGGAFAAASGDAGVSPLSQSRIASREALDGQDLRDAMLSLSSDVKRNAEKLTEAVMAMSSRNLKSFKFELNPEGLGSMQIKIDSTDDGDAVRIGISASSSQARGILAQGMDALREGLLRNGIFAQAELEGGDQGSLAQDGSSGQGAWQGREGGQGQGQGSEGSLGRSGTLFAGSGMAGADDEALAPDADKGLSLEDGLSLFA